MAIILLMQPQEWFVFLAVRVHCWLAFSTLFTRNCGSFQQSCSPFSQPYSYTHTWDFSVPGAGLQIILMQILAGSISSACPEFSELWLFLPKYIPLLLDCLIVLVEGTFNSMIQLALKMLDDIRHTTDPREAPLATACQLDFASLTTTLSAYQLCSF